MTFTACGVVFIDLHFIHHLAIRDTSRSGTSLLTNIKQVAAAVRTPKKNRSSRDMANNR